MWAKKPRKNIDNKGKKCKTRGCKRMAKVKGFCIGCYNLRRNRNVTKCK